MLCDVHLRGWASYTACTGSIEWRFRAKMRQIEGRQLPGCELGLKVLIWHVQRRDSAAVELEAAWNVKLHPQSTLHAPQSAPLITFLVLTKCLNDNRPIPIIGKTSLAAATDTSVPSTDVAPASCTHTPALTLSTCTGIGHLVLVHTGWYVLLVFNGTFTTNRWYRAIGVRYTLCRAAGNTEQHKQTKGN